MFKDVLAHLSFLKGNKAEAPVKWSSSCMKKKYKVINKTGQEVKFKSEVAGIDWSYNLSKANRFPCKATKGVSRDKAVHVRA